MRLWGWGLIYWTPTFLQRAYHLDVGQAGAVTGNIHLIGGSIATVGTAWLLSRPSMADPRRVVWLLAAGIGLATIPSMIAYWTHSLWVCKLMFWIFIPAIYFYIGPVSACSTTSRPAICAICSSRYRCWSRIYSISWSRPGWSGSLSDWFAGAHGSDAASLRLALLCLAPTGFWAAYHLYLASKTIVADQKRAIGYTKSWAP